MFKKNDVVEILPEFQDEGVMHYLGLRKKAQTANYKVAVAQWKVFHHGLVRYCLFRAKKPL